MVQGIGAVARFLCPVFQTAGFLVSHFLSALILVLGSKSDSHEACTFFTTAEVLSHDDWSQSMRHGTTSPNAVLEPPHSSEHQAAEPCQVSRRLVDSW